MFTTDDNYENVNVWESLEQDGFKLQQKRPSLLNKKLSPLSDWSAGVLQSNDWSAGIAQQTNADTKQQDGVKRRPMTLSSSSSSRGATATTGRSPKRNLDATVFGRMSGLTYTATQNSNKVPKTSMSQPVADSTATIMDNSQQGNNKDSDRDSDSDNDNSSYWTFSSELGDSDEIIEKQKDEEHMLEYMVAATSNATSPNETSIVVNTNDDDGRQKTASNNFESEDNNDRSSLSVTSISDDNITVSRPHNNEQESHPTTDAYVHDAG